MLPGKWFSTFFLDVSGRRLSTHTVFITVLHSSRRVYVHGPDFKRPYPCLRVFVSSFMLYSHSRAPALSGHVGTLQVVKRVAIHRRPLLAGAYTCAPLRSRSGSLSLGSPLTWAINIAFLCEYPRICNGTSAGFSMSYQALLVQLLELGMERVPPLGSCPCFSEHERVAMYFWRICMVGFLLPFFGIIRLRFPPWL